MQLLFMWLKHCEQVHRYTEGDSLMHLSVSAVRNFAKSTDSYQVN